MGMGKGTTGTGTEKIPENNNIGKGPNKPVGEKPTEIPNKTPAFRGVHIAIGLKGDHAIQSTPGVGFFEIYGVLKLILTKMEKDLLNQ